MNVQLIASLAASFVLGGAVGGGAIYQFTSTAQVSCPAVSQSDNAARAKFFEKKPITMTGKSYP